MNGNGLNKSKFFQDKINVLILHLVDVQFFINCS